MSLFAELKRRNVVKVGAAYLLVAWVVVQAASIGFPAFDAPPGWRNSPGMKRKLERMGAVAYWRAKGFAPQCHPVGDKDFTCD